MSERFSSHADGVASGTDKTIITLFNPAATPTRRAALFDLIVGSVASPADQSAKFHLGRITALGTEGSGYTPVNLDPAGPAGELDAGCGVFGGEPTYTASKQLLVFSINQRATWRWIAAPGCEILTPATQNNGVGLKTSSSTSTQAHEACIFHQE